jgi:hypothetical protein
MIPADQILENQYTYGNEYRLSSGEYYKGYYCIVLNTQYYTGKTYSDDSKEIFKTSTNPLSKNPTSLPPQSTPVRYFVRKVNVFPITIKEVNEQTYVEYVHDPFYQTAVISTPQDVAKADTQIPGLKSFL